MEPGHWLVNLCRSCPPEPPGLDPVMLMQPRDRSKGDTCLSPRLSPTSKTDDLRSVAVVRHGSWQSPTQSGPHRHSLTPARSPRNQRKHAKCSSRKQALGFRQKHCSIHQVSLPQSGTTQERSGWAKQCLGGGYDEED